MNFKMFLLVGIIFMQSVDCSVLQIVKREGSMEGCAMATLDKCYGTFPTDGSDSTEREPRVANSTDLIESIGEIPSIPVCQWFCKEVYAHNCTWFAYDTKTLYCNIFKGSLDDYRNGCDKHGYATFPSYVDCPTSFDTGSGNGCYNFREDYCRFEEYYMLENLEDVASLSLCQRACQMRRGCTFFTYFDLYTICRLEGSLLRDCDIVHGPSAPSYESCLKQNKIPWYQATTTTTTTTTTAITTTTDSVGTEDSLGR